jgi:hypothetical protein
MLFVELVLIRWTVANVVYLAYFTNFILLASFLGIGLGFLRSTRPKEGFRHAPLALFALTLFVTLLPVQVVRTSTKRTFSGLFGLPAIPMWIMLPLMFLAVVAVMALVAEGVGRAFALFEPLEAYRLDILGSIAGIAAFSVLSFLGTPPVIWGLVIAATFIILLRGELAPWRLAAVLGLVVVLGVQSFAPRTWWSPYYRISASAPSSDGGMGIRVNGLPHQAILPLSRLKTEQPFYLYPYTHLVKNELGNVLIVGAGTGNDVAVALSQGAKHIDAVEIDPVLYQIGRDHHPDLPYQDPRVSVHIDDGRAFLEQTSQRYNLILFALPDSLVQISGQSSLRLESFLFTIESIQAVREHLAPDGVFSMYNYYRPFVFDRFAATLEAVFGHAPCVDLGTNLGPRRQGVLTVSISPGAVTCAARWSGDLTSAPEPATDDHPFPYVYGRTIPLFYYASLLLMLAAAILLVRLGSGPLRDLTAFVDLFFMGAAFLLLETKNVVQFALLFGTTWLVNALVFAGVLLSVFAAVEVARRVRLPRPAPLYLALLTALAIAWVVPEHRLLALAPAVRFAVATAIAFAPIFLANLVFAQRFKGEGSSTVAFGANLLGAMVGGVLEYGAIITGYRDLLFVVGLFYALAFVIGHRHIRISMS